MADTPADDLAGRLEFIARDFGRLSPEMVSDLREAACRLRTDTTVEALREIVARAMHDDRCQVKTLGNPDKAWAAMRGSWKARWREKADEMIDRYGTAQAQEPTT